MTRPLIEIDDGLLLATPVTRSFRGFADVQSHCNHLVLHDHEWCLRARTETKIETGC